MNLWFEREGKKYEFNLERITQLCGQNMKEKNLIISSLTKYFSSKKYFEYEGKGIETIKLNGESVGRKYFDTYVISNRQNLVDFIALTKAGLMNRFLVYSMDSMKYQKRIDDIQMILEDIYKNLNEEIMKGFVDISLDYEIDEVVNMAQSSKLVSEKYKHLERLPEMVLFENLFALIEKLSAISPERMLIIIENVDHILMYEEYVDILCKAKELSNRFDIHFVFSSSIEGFVYIDDEVVEGINVINDDIFSFSELERFKEFVEANYPCNISIETEELVKNLERIVHKIGRNDYSINQRAEVLLKLIDTTHCIEHQSDNLLNRLEFSFLNGEDIV